MDEHAVGFHKVWKEPILGLMLSQGWHAMQGCGSVSVKATAHWSWLPNALGPEHSDGVSRDPLKFRTFVTTCTQASGEPVFLPYQGYNCVRESWNYEASGVLQLATESAMDTSSCL